MCWSSAKNIQNVKWEETEEIKEDLDEEAEEKEEEAEEAKEEEEWKLEHNRHTHMDIIFIDLVYRYISYLSICVCLFIYSYRYQLRFWLNAQSGKLPPLNWVREKP